MNAIKRHSYKLQYAEDEISPVEQAIMETKEYKQQQKSKDDVTKAIKQVKDTLKYANLQPKKQEIITLADKR